MVFKSINRTVVELSNAAVCSMNLLFDNLLFSFCKLQPIACKLSHPRASSTCVELSKLDSDRVKQQPLVQRDLWGKV